MKLKEGHESAGWQVLLKSGRTLSLQLGREFPVLASGAIEAICLVILHPTPCGIRGNGNKLPCIWNKAGYWNHLTWNTSIPYIMLFLNFKPWLCLSTESTHFPPSCLYLPNISRWNRHIYRWECKSLLLWVWIHRLHAMKWFTEYYCVLGKSYSEKYFHFFSTMYGARVFTWPLFLWSVFWVNFSLPLIFTSLYPSNFIAHLCHWGTPNGTEFIVSA